MMAFQSVVEFGNLHKNPTVGQTRCMIRFNEKLMEEVIELKYCGSYKYGNKEGEAREKSGGENY